MQHSRWTVLTLLCTLAVTAHARSCTRPDVLVATQPTRIPARFDLSFSCRSKASLPSQTNAPSFTCANQSPLSKRCGASLRAQTRGNHDMWTESPLERGRICDFPRGLPKRVKGSTAEMHSAHLACEVVSLLCGWQVEKLCASIRGHKKLVRIDLSWNELKVLNRNNVKAQSG